MKRDEIIALAEKYQKKADRAYQNYQETGIARYDRERRTNEDLADALYIAAGQAENRDAYAHLRADVVYYASKLDNAVYYDVPKEVLVAIVKDYVGMASVLCKYRRLEDG